MSTQFLAVFRREIIYMWRDRGLRYIWLLGPILGLLLFGGIYTAQVIKNIPAAVVDLDRTSSSREVIHDLAGEDYLRIIAYPANYKDLEELIKRGDVVVGVVIPENYGRDLGNGHGARIMAIVDGSNTIYATNANNAVLGVSQTINARAGIKTLVAGGLTTSQASAAFQMVDLREKPWFNPTLNYAYFLVLAFALNVWQHSCMLVSTMNAIRETRFRSWLQIKAAGYSLKRFFIFKSLAHILVFMAMLVPLYALAYGIWKFPLAGNISVLFLFSLVFIIAVHSIGTLISSLANNEVDASRFGMIIAVPSFVISGYIWPIEAMPQALQPFAWILPQTWFFQGFNYLTFKNPGMESMLPYFLILAGMALVCYLMAALVIYGKERIS